MQSLRVQTFAAPETNHMHVVQFLKTVLQKVISCVCGVGGCGVGGWDRFYSAYIPIRTNVRSSKRFVYPFLHALFY